jgi:predicted MPP superfamily phosphohydrolase
VNEFRTICRGGKCITICGTDDPSSEHDNLDAALEGAPPDAFTLLAAHCPDIAPEAAFKGVDVMLSGHTHGGQVALPFYGPITTHSVLGRKISSGVYDSDRLFGVVGSRRVRTQIVISRGVGVSGFSLRFLCPPEINLVTLCSL